MTEKIARIEQDENYVSHEGLLNEVSEEDYKESRRAEKEDTEDNDKDINIRKSNIYKEIRDVLGQKETGVEPFDAKGVSFALPPKQQDKPFLKKALLGLAFLASTLGFSSKATASGDPADSLKNKVPTEKSLGKTDNKEGLKIIEITPTVRQEWNAFIDFVHTKKEDFGGLEKLDKDQNLARKLFSDYQKLHPGTSINYDIVASVQKEMEDLRESVKGFAERRNDPNAKNLMGYISKVDGIFGDNTAQSKFPFMIETQYHNNNVVSSKNLGLVNSNLETGSSAQLKKRIPEGAKIIDHEFYEDPVTGDLVKYK